MVRPATISQLGRSFAKHPAWVRHHIVTLERAGLVELAEERVTRNYTEKFYRATAGAFSVHELIVPEYDDGEHLVALGSNDPVLELLAAGEDAEDPSVVPVSIGSLDGLIALRQGLSDIAGCHLLDVDSGDYNVPFVRHLFPDRSVVVLTLVHREQGLVTASGNPLKLREIADVVRPDVRLINRNPGSGTRLWLDQQLQALGVSASLVPGYDTTATTHAEVAEAVASGTADVGIAVRVVAERAGLGFVPLFRERYDLVIPAERYEDPALRPLLDRLGERAFRDAVGRLPGYDMETSGREVRLAV
jgi:putative molybdopterin biosynthesis protein